MHKQTEISGHQTMSLKTGMSYDSGCSVGGVWGHFLSCVKRLALATIMQKLEGGASIPWLLGYPEGTWLCH